MISISTHKVMAAEHKASIVTKDITIYVGQVSSFSRKEIFVSATDKNGNSVPFEDGHIGDAGNPVNVNKPGKYKIGLAYLDSKAGIKIFSMSTVTVKEDKSSLKTKDLILESGQSWTAADNLVSATDEDGNAIPYSDNRISGNGATIDTSKGGTYTFTYTYHGIVKDTHSSFKVTVKNPTSISSKDASYLLGEYWDLTARAKLLNSAKDGDTEIPYSSNRIVPIIPDTINNSIKNSRIDVLFDDNVTLTLDGSKSSSSKATAKYGNAIILRGYEKYYHDRDAAGAFALLNNNSSPIVVSTSGGSEDNEEIHSYFGGQNYVELAQYSMKNIATLDISKTNNEKINIKGDGDTLKQDFLDKWGTNRVLSVNYGDVIKAKEAEGKIGYSQDSTYIGLSKYKNPKEIFFEVTQNGFSPLSVNQLIPKKMTVAYGSKNTEIDSELKKTIDTDGNSDITVEKFSQYPDTTKVGNQIAKVLVSEKLTTTGKKVEYEYEIPVTVEGSLELSVPDSVNFGEYELGRSTELEWPASDKKIIISDTRNTPGWQLTVKIINSTNVGFPSKVYWKNLKNNNYRGLLSKQNPLASRTSEGVLNLTNLFDENEGIYIDYSAETSLREDSATFEWTLLSTSKEVTP